MNVDELSGTPLDLLFYLAIGYTDFEYYTALKCWRIEKPFTSGSSLIVVGVVPDAGCVFKHHPFLITYSSEQSYLLREMREENIALSWGPNKEYCLHFQAFPEIRAKDKSLEIAFKRVMTKKELGDFVSQEALLQANVFRNRSTIKTSISK